MKVQTYHIITIGCQMNKSDSERIASYLEKLGFKYSKDQFKAGLVVLTTCGVRQSAEDRIYGLIPRIKEHNPKAKIILTGCLALRQDVIKRLKKKVDLFIPVSKIYNLEKWLKGKKILPVTKDQLDCAYLKIKPKYSSRVCAFIPIGNGCNNFCSYCVVPYARGREVYRPAKDIIKDAESLIKQGYKEINLIAQNVNSYSDPRNPANTFPTLLRAINDIHGDFWIRFSTSHPKDMSDELIRVIAKSKKICKHIHLPVQSGDNEILKAMNRRYSVLHYKKLINKAMKACQTPGSLPASLSTDIIVGFPGETKKQFENTAKLFKDLKFDLAYISQYSPRPGTVAAKMKDNVSKTEKKRREEALMKILRKTALANNKKYVGRAVMVLIEGKTKKGQFYGKTETNKVVKFTPARDKDLTGHFVPIKITKARDFGLDGKIE